MKGAKLGSQVKAGFCEGRVARSAVYGLLSAVAMLWGLSVDLHVIAGHQRDPMAFMTAFTISFGRVRPG